jgi:acetate kinase
MVTDASVRGRFLVLNGGSSSVKFALIDLPDEQPLASGFAERLGTPQASLMVRIGTRQTAPQLTEPSHGGAVAAIMGVLEQLPGGLGQLIGIGHRVVHGGEFFAAPALISSETLDKIERCERLAPLHNPANASVIRATLERFPEVPQVAVFDTAFHQTLPDHAYLYAIPYHYYREQGVRRYGAHGTSHHYVGLKAAEALKRPFESLSIVTAHLGNGCSACAIRDGQSVDTSMGLTPLEGMVMGTRSGDVDPNLFSYLHSLEGSSIEQITHMLNRQSGLLGVSGVSNDLRSVIEAADTGNTQAAIALDLFCYRFAKSVLGLCAGLERLDALVFTGGIGENSSRVRAAALGYLKLLGPVVDIDRNSCHGKSSRGVITREQSPLRVLVVPTNEEWMIAHYAASLIQAQY